MMIRAVSTSSPRENRETGASRFLRVGKIRNGVTRASNRCLRASLFALPESPAVALITRFTLFILDVVLRNENNFFVLFSFTPKFLRTVKSLFNGRGRHV